VEVDACVVIYLLCRGEINLVDGDIAAMLVADVESGPGQSVVVNLLRRATVLEDERDSILVLKGGCGRCWRRLWFGGRLFCRRLLLIGRWRALIGRLLGVAFDIRIRRIVWLASGGIVAGRIEVTGIIGVDPSVDGNTVRNSYPVVTRISAIAVGSGIAGTVVIKAGSLRDRGEAWRSAAMGDGTAGETGLRYRGWSCAKRRCASCRRCTVAAREAATCSSTPSAALRVQGCRNHYNSQRESGEVFHIHIGRLDAMKSHS
jgi:hypothetical protein